MVVRFLHLRQLEPAQPRAPLVPAHARRMSVLAGSFCSKRSMAQTQPPQLDDQSLSTPMLSSIGVGAAPPSALNFPGSHRARDGQKKPARISRREVQRIIKSYDCWYQDITFGTMLETKFTFRSWLRRALGVARICKNEVLISSLPDLSGKRVIDIGCNSGLYSVEASCRGADFVLGVDRSVGAIQQANQVAEIFLRLGRPVGKIEFQLIADINRHLELLDDKDVLIACCVLYHLGPLQHFRDRVRKSRIRTLILQGNTRRRNNLGEFNNPSSPFHEPNEQTWGNVLCDVEGMSRFCQSMSFELLNVAHASHTYPVVIGSR